MKQVVQDVRSGRVHVDLLPEAISRGQVLVSVHASTISSGTERYVLELGSKSLLGKARSRPDQVRRVLEKVRQEGLRVAVSQARAKLADPMPLGYSAAGVVLETGHRVSGFKPGDRVAAAGPHAGIVAVSHNLCARIPDEVPFEAAAYTSIGAIALQGVRLSRATLGERVLVIGLGLIGQITVCVLKAQGCIVFGVDLDPDKLKVARSLGCDETAIGQPQDAVMRFSDGYGVDAVLIAAATSSNGPVEFAAEVCRPKARIVLIGVSGLELPRAPFFAKELEFTVSSSLGAGRGDPVYEERGVDYPIGHARWTAKRNMETVLQLMADGRLPVEKLTTHRFDVDDAPSAYEHVLRPKGFTLGIVLRYPERKAEVRRVPTSVAGTGTPTAAGVSVIGAGNFARLVLLPAVRASGGVSLRGICSSGGLTATQAGKEHGFAFASADAEEVLRDGETSAVMIATRHDLHADLTIRALQAGKHVFVEKPLAHTEEELERLIEALSVLGPAAPFLMVGYNRRFAPGLVRSARHFETGAPRTVSYRFVAGPVPMSSWVQDPDQGGGRIVGETCHAIDACIALTGSLPVRVFAESVVTRDSRETSDDQVAITMRHADGSLSSIVYHAAGDAAGPRERFEVFGGGRTAVLDGWNEGELWAGHRRVRFKGKRDKGHNAEVAAFFEAVRKGGPSPIPLDQLIAGARASFAAVRSLRSGEAITLDS